MQKIEISRENLYRDVLKLTKVRPSRNYLHTKVLTEVSQYIYDQFSSLDCRTSFQDYKVDGRGYRNVIAHFGPQEGELLVVGAHYDVAGEQPGADDNASGVAGLLEIARVLDRINSFKYPVVLVAYCLEEPPYFATHNMGSAFHAKSLYDNKVPVQAMICLDMIGYFSDSSNSQGFPNESLKEYYPSTGNYIVVVGKTGQETVVQHVCKLMRLHSNIPVESIHLPESEGLVGLSDHRNYWNYGYRAVMVNDTAFLRNPHYHRSTDIIESLNFSKMAEVVRGVAGTILNF